MTARLIAACLLSWVAAAQALSQPGSQTVWTGVYTEPQALRGLAVYRTTCTYCHHEDLLGGEDLIVPPPALVGHDFADRFVGKSVGHLLKTVASTMPWRKQKVTPQEYADVVAYILKENGFPAGTQELPLDPTAVDGILITAPK